MYTSLFSSLTFLTLLLSTSSLTSAFPPKLLPPFTLRIPSSTPSPLAGLFLIKNTDPLWDSYMGFGLGLNISGPPIELSIKPNSGADITQGEITAAGNASVPLWLRPTHGTPRYFLRLAGDPNLDAWPMLNYWKGWKIEELKPPTGSKPKPIKLRYRLVYKWPYMEEEYSVPDWTACYEGKGVEQVEPEWKIYHGFAGIEPWEGGRCVKAFDLEVVFLEN